MAAARKHSMGLLREIVHGHFPPVQFAMGYGSGVFAQGTTPSSSSSSTADQPMIDFIFGVEDAESWHRENMARNPSHYSAASMLGPRAVAWLQRTSQGVYYHPFVRVPVVGDEENASWREIKYGVMSMDHLCSDLEHWDSLFISGRLHKPVAIVADDAGTEVARRTNLRAALHTALLLLPPRFTERQLFAGIAGLSYAGDLRFSVGAESPRKVVDIVTGNLGGFRELYAPIITESPALHQVLSLDADADADAHNNDGGADGDDSDSLVFGRDVERDAVVAQVATLPSNVRRTLGLIAGTPSGAADEDVAARLHDEGVLAATLQKSLSQVLRRRQLSQYVKGLLSAGVVKSVSYARAKLGKGVLGGGRGHQQQRQQHQQQGRGGGGGRGVGAADDGGRRTARTTTTTLTR